MAASLGKCCRMADDEEAMRTATPQAPVTLRRPVDAHDMHNLDKPHIPRALVAADNEHPRGSVGHKHRNYTVLQQHVEFFDRNKDGVIYPWETFLGFKALGCSTILSYLAMLLINIPMSYPSLDGWIPSPLFPIYIKNIHRNVHGSDTGVYDNEGRFVPYKFEELFSKFARTYPDRLTFGELIDMTEAIRDAYDPFGWVASKLEWGMTYWLVKDEKGLVPKEAIRGAYDGSVFYYIEKREDARRIAKYF